MHPWAFREQLVVSRGFALTRREEYLDLIAALAKLGVRVRVPDALQQVA